MAAVVVERKQDQTNLTDCGECLWRMDLGMCVRMRMRIKRELSTIFFFHSFFLYSCDSLR